MQRGGGGEGGADERMRNIGEERRKKKQKGQGMKKDETKNETGKGPQFPDLGGVAVQQAMEAPVGRR